MVVMSRVVTDIHNLQQQIMHMNLNFRILIYKSKFFQICISFSVYSSMLKVEAEKLSASC